MSFRANKTNSARQPEAGIIRLDYVIYEASIVLDIINLMRPTNHPGNTPGGQTILGDGYCNNHHTGMFRLPSDVG